MKLNSETLVGCYEVDVDVYPILPRGHRDVLPM